MENKALAFFKANIGKESTSSPSPVGRWLKGKLVEVNENSLVFSFVIREEMCNPMGILHGGMIATMLDDVMGATTFAQGEPEFFTSINLNLDFLKSAKKGEEVQAKAEVIRKGRAVMYLQATLTNSNGDLLARATSNLIRTKIKSGF